MKSLFVALFLSLFALSAMAQDGADGVREEFSKSLSDAEAGNSGGRDSTALREYVLYPYLQSMRLRQQLKSSPDADTDTRIREFLETSGRTVANRELSREWLQSLAQRKEWPEFRAAYRDDVADSDLRCQQLLARANSSGDASLKADALKLWMTGQKLSPTCIPAFEWIKQQGWLTPELLEQRSKLALAAGNADLAESIAQGLPPEQAESLQRWARLIRTPQAELENLIEDPKQHADPDAVLDGFSRLARKDAQQALKLYKPLLKSQKLSGNKTVPFTSALALALATNRLPEALPYFQKIPEAAIDDKLREWRLRAALWNDDWKRVRNWSRHLPKTMATLDRWNYWQARGLEQSIKTKKQAQALYQTLSLKNNLYGVLASQRLGRAHTPQPQPQSVDSEIQKKLMQNPAIVRARELHRAGRNEWAAIEWSAALQGANPQTQVQAGLLASTWGWHSQAIPTLAAVSVYDDFAVTYPIVYEPLVEESAKRAMLPPKVVYGVMRQESLYDPRAVSPANAYGLLQLLLPTARTVARRWKQSEPSREDLFDPETNLGLGAAYLHDMQEKWNGSLILALGSYNAGPTAVARWLPERPKDADIWIENIPFAETRGYIQRILWHICVFGWRQTGEAQDLSPLLKPVSKPAP